MVKYLGVTFDSNLTWKNYVNELCLKLSKTVGILIMLYYSLIYPFLTYGIQVWGLTYPTYLKPVTTLQKRVVRLMTFSDPRSHSEPLLKSLRLLKFSDIIHLEILSFVYQWYHKLSPSCFVNYFSPVSSIHSYNTCQSQVDNLFVKSVICMQQNHVQKSNLRAARNKEISFISQGFSNWKKALTRIKEHQVSECHNIATDYQINLPRTCGNVLEMSSDAAKKTMESNRICFIKVIESLQYLAPQGMAMQGDR